MTQQALDTKYTVDGLAGYEGGELSYSRTFLKGGSEDGDNVDELLYVPEDMYFHTRDGEWFVQSPWSQGTRPEEIPAGGIGAYLLDYDVITGAMRGVPKLSDDAAADMALIHLAAPADLIDLAAGDDETIELLDDADGSAEIELWISSDSELPFALEVRTDIELEHVGVVTTAQYEFVSYNQPIEIPERPAEARPYRDLLFPEAPCISEEFDGCLAAQTELQPIAQNSCAGSGRRVCLVPLGLVSPALVYHLVDHYLDRYGLTITVLTPKAVPAEIADPLRQQADAAALIDYVGDLFPEAYADPEAVLIGVTAVDLYDKTSHFRYLFGLKGTPEDPKAMISFFRMTPEFYGEPPSEEVFFSRARKLLSKYVGLLFYRLPPSNDPRSPMFDHILSADDLDEMDEPLPIEEAR